MALERDDADNDFDSMLRNSRSWTLAVWGLRLAGIGLSFALIGLITRSWSNNVGLTILSIGVVVYLFAVVFIYIGFIPAIRAFAKPRPSFWKIRRKLMKDALHFRPVYTQATQR
jgi:hypothetical protein